MSKKKKPLQTSAKGKKSIDENSWRVALDSAEIIDENWWCIVTMMIETKVEHSRCASLFHIGAEEGNRRAVYSLTCQKMLANVKVISKKNLDKCPVIQGVCHYANKVLNENDGTLPTWLMAQVIKYHIFCAKEESIGIIKKQEQLERAIDEEYRIMQSSTSPGHMSKTKIGNDERFDSKANTKLRKRDEEWRDVVYIDDAPSNGPNLYVILTGFRDPNLPMELMRAGMPLSCILQIKRSNEKLDGLAEDETHQEDEEELTKFNSFSGSDIDEFELLKFWSTIEEHLKDPETYPAFRDIAFFTLCPPDIRETFNEEDMANDIYDKVSYLVYDVFHYYQHHSRYLQSMKIEENIFDEKNEKCDMEIYNQLLDNIPLDCVSVPVVLCAMLLQTEANDLKSIGKESLSKQDNTSSDTKITANNENLVPSKEECSVSFVAEKLKLLDRENALGSQGSFDNDESKDLSDLDLILHGDSLNAIVRFVDKRGGEKSNVPSVKDFVNNILRVLWYPRIMNLWDEHEVMPTKIKKYKYHLDKARCYFDAKVSREETMHYLHILAFEKLIFDGTPLSQKNLKTRRIKGDEIDSALKSDSVFREKISNLQFVRTGDEPFLKFGEQSRSQSDSNIDYGKSMWMYANYAPLFHLIDPRELLVSGFLKLDILNKEYSAMNEKPLLEDFDDVELLPLQVFLQVVYQCLTSFDHFKIIYFEPTDSFLLLFAESYPISDTIKEETVCKIRTPVCFHDFYKYIVQEEEEWIKREEEKHRVSTAESTGRLMNQAAENYDAAMMFGDEDFILPGSLKARNLERSEKKIFLETNSIDATGTKAKNWEEESKKEKDQSSDPGAKEEETYEFIGYDLGSLRVQISNRRKTFASADGTLVRVEIDEWLYKNTDLRIAVTLRDCSLRLFHRIGARQTAEMFHLTTKGGIILAFSKLTKPLGVTSNLPLTWRDLSFDFRASWPSGLIIKLVTGDGPSNPFYIHQSYISKSSNDKIREVCRKFLRNGTVLKYLSDNTIIVLRPNGVIVTCLAFEHVESGYEKSFDTIFMRGEGPRKVSTQSVKRNKKTSKVFQKPQHLGMVEENPARQDSTTDGGSFSTMSETPITVKVSRYTVVNHDGRQYDVLDDLIVSEQHRLLVRTASGHEVNEIFTRRADGTDMLLNLNGELIVSFPDGTRITTGYTIEKEPVMCDWTEDEILRYFLFRGMEEANECGSSTPSLNPKFLEETFSGSNVQYPDEITEILNSDAFVSVLLTCRVEHKNYATVFYDQSAVNCTLSMPDDLRVSISRRGHYEVSMAVEVNLKIEEESLVLSNSVCSSCGSKSTSTYNFSTVESPRTIFTTIDSFGNILEVKDDGTTCYRGKSQPPGYRKFISRRRVLDSEANKEEESYVKIEAERDEKNLAEDKDRCYCKGFKSRCQYRIFAMNRDLTAYEYIHRFVRKQAEEAAIADNGTSVFLYPFSYRPNLRRLITFAPVEVNLELRPRWLLLQCCKLMPANHDRKDLLRSTYSIPYNWLFPFGENGDGIWKNSHKLPLINSVEAGDLPELLEIRILYNFKAPSENATSELQKALGRYWISLARKMELELPLEEEKQKLEEPLNNLENNLRYLALGLNKRIDVATYKTGLEKKLRISCLVSRSESTRFLEVLARKSLKMKELEWYKDCMKTGSVLPYFKSIRGTCFLWINECVENVLKISQKIELIRRNNENCECEDSCACEEPCQYLD